MTNKPCPQCPWRLTNHGKRHSGGFYTKANLTRLWNQIRKGNGLQTCHLTDPCHPDHIASGCSPDAIPKECPGSVILIRREILKLASLSITPGTIDETSIAVYLLTRKKGLTKRGMIYWITERIQLGGVPFFGRPKLPKVNVDDKEIALPEYLCK